MSPSPLSSPSRTRASRLLTTITALAGAGLSFGCELLLGADFDQRLATRDSCVPACGAGTRCDRETRGCSCAPATCEPDFCGARIESHCGLAQDCGDCPVGQYCGSETPNRCSPVACMPKTCAELGQTSGVHATCGILVDCNPPPACNGCRDDQVCTQSGCCIPFTHPLDACGSLDDGCGHVVEVSCPEGTGLVCQGNKCKDPTDACEKVDAVCGLNAAYGSYVDCDGSCPGGATCNLDGTPPRHVCGDCVARCPSEAQATCGVNISGECDGQSIQCPGQCPNEEQCVVRGGAFQCCVPECPPTPTNCGANDDGCDGVIQCPGPCANPGETCQNTGDGAFACSL
jgi:hypothetical protein